MAYRDRVRLGAKVDIKSKFEKFEKLARKDENENSVKKTTERTTKPSYATRRQEMETKRTETKIGEKKDRGLDRTTRGIESLKLKETNKEGASGRPSSGGDRAKTGTSTFASRRAEERRKNEETTKKMKSIEQRMQERKHQKMADQKKKVQGRAAFKQQLEANAPKRDKSEQSVLARAETNIDKLLKWVQFRINAYPGINVQDWGPSWADGKAFCALVQSMYPEDFSVGDVDHSGKDRKGNFQLAFDFASEHGVPPLLDADDMASVPVPDSRSVITYVHTIYKVMVHEKAEKERQEKEKQEQKNINEQSDEED